MLTLHKLRQSKTIKSYLKQLSKHKYTSSTEPKLSSYRPRLPKIITKSLPDTMKGVKFEARPMYLDFQATTNIDPRVIDIMNMSNVVEWGNPHSSTHYLGWKSDDYVENARLQIANLINANSREIIFTSGATESNNLAIKGYARIPKSEKNKDKKHIITVQTEHKCVLDSCRRLEDEGYTITYLPVQKNGIINLDILKQHITPQTLLISVMYVNNEIGVIQPIEQIGQICRENDIKFHCDAAQALGKIPIDVNKCNIDLMSMSGHKIYGPKGIGALYVRRRPRIQLKSIINGGGQERGLRSGTLPAPLIIGFGKACQIANECMEEDDEHITKLSNKLYDGINSELEEVILNGDREQRYIGNLNFSFSFVEGESLLMGLKNVCVSSGSACTSASLEPSYVLRAIGVSEDLAHTSIRYGIGRFTTEKEIDYAINETVNNVKRLREMSPLYDLWKDGTLQNITWTHH